MSAAIDRTPDELWLMVFDPFTYNELRPILGVCQRWRALAHACPAFWRDIMTPRRSITVPTAIRVACARLECTIDRNFTLRMRGAHPEVLSAASKHIPHVEHLDVQIGDVRGISAVISTLNSLTAPRLRTFTLRMQDEDDLPPTAFGHPLLSSTLFSGTDCPLLTRVWLTEVTLTSSEVLPCFSSVTDLRLSQTDDLPSRWTPDIFSHFPALRRLGLCAAVGSLGSRFDQQQLEIIRRWKTADYTRLEYVELLGDWWDLAKETSWPLKSVPHVFADSSECTSLPFLPPITFANGHLVFDPQEGEDEDLCIIRFGNDDWTFSRGCVSDDCDNEPTSHGRRRVAARFRFELSHMGVARALQTASVPESLLPLARLILDTAYNITMLRIMIGQGSNTMSSMEGLSHLRSRNIRSLVLRGEFASDVCARDEYDAVVFFVKCRLDPCVLPVSLLLENVELSGERPASFATYFRDVGTQDPDAWSYHNARSMLNRYRFW